MMQDVHMELNPELLLQNSIPQGALSPAIWA
jgi:hypothetical protein